jgi:WD40 repeat protein
MGSVLAVSLTPDGHQALSGSHDRTLRLWDLETGQSLRTLEDHMDCVVAVAVISDGHRAVSGSDDRTLRLWDLKTGQRLRIFEGHASSVLAVALTRDGRQAVSASDDRTLRLWDLKSGKLLRTLKGHTGSVLAVSLTPDGHRAVSGSNDGTLRLWDLNTGQSLRTFEGHTSSVLAVAVTPDGRLVLSASGEEWPRILGPGADERGSAPLRLWDLESGTLLRTLRGHTGSVRAVALTPDGRAAVSGSDDGTLRLWDLQTSTEIALFTTDSPIWSCAVSADGQTFVAADQSGRMHFLRLVEADETKPPIGDTKIHLPHRKEQATDS